MPPSHLHGQIVPEPSLYFRLQLATTPLQLGAEPIRLGQSVVATIRSCEMTRSMRDSWGIHMDELFSLIIMDIRVSIKSY